jgi:triphosphatase
MGGSPTTSPTPPGDSVEIEWQYDALDLRPVERWLARTPTEAAELSLPSVTVLAKPPKRLFDHYLDTDDWRIARAGYVLRTRRQGRSDEATLKDTRPAGAGGLRQRLEVTERLPSGDVTELGPASPVGRRVRAVAGKRTLRQVLEVRTRRRPFSLRIDGKEVAEIALDDTVIGVGDHQRPVHLRRVEMEVDPGWVAALTPLAERLRSACGLQPASLSKFEAGLLALGLTVPGPPDLGPAAVDADSTFGDLAFAIIRRHLAVLLAREPGTRLGEDIEELHDMRVATRRLRAALDLFGPVLPVRAGALREELRWLAMVLGAVRDLDVQLERMDQMDRWATEGIDTIETTTPSPLRQLRTLLEIERDSARDAMLQALDSTRWERLAAGLAALARQGPNRRLAATRTPACVAVPDLVEARHREATRAAKRAKRTGRAADFHRLRIRCKRLRYSLEFTADLYGGQTTRFTRRLASLQDLLGLMQDADVAIARLKALAFGGHATLPIETVFAMGGVAEHYRSEAGRLLAGMSKHVRVLQGKEWQELSGLMDRRRLEALAVQPGVRAVPPGAPTLSGPPDPAPGPAAPATAADMPDTTGGLHPAPAPTSPAGRVPAGHEGGLGGVASAANGRAADSPAPDRARAAEAAGIQDPGRTNGHNPTTEAESDDGPVRPAASPRPPR